MHHAEQLKYFLVTGEGKVYGSAEVIYTPGSSMMVGPATGRKLPCERGFTELTLLHEVPEVSSRQLTERCCSKQATALIAHSMFRSVG